MVAQTVPVSAGVWKLSRDHRVTTAGDLGLELDSVSRDGEKPSDPPAQPPPPPGSAAAVEAGAQRGQGGALDQRARASLGLPASAPRSSDSGVALSQWQAELETSVSTGRSQPEMPPE